MDFSWIAREDDISPAALTVRAQTISPNDNGRLLWDVFMPRRDVPSVRLTTYTTENFRPAADRREWNQRGRYIPQVLGPIREIVTTPTESYFKVEEEEQQRLAEATLGNQALIREAIGVSIPRRTDQIVEALYRRIELDVFTAWALGQFTATDPQRGVDQVFDYGFDTDRYTAVDWSAANDAYAGLLAFVEAGVELVGPVEGAVMRRTTMVKIKADAPQGADGFELTFAQLQDRITQDLGTAFRIVVLENTVQRFADGGIAPTSVKIWPAQQVALIPQGGQVGTTAFAPVVRAMDLASQVPDASIDIRGATVVYGDSGMGRELTVEAQINQIPTPNEQLIYVNDANV